jgi:hypothetical protein
VIQELGGAVLRRASVLSGSQAGVDRSGEEQRAEALLDPGFSLFNGSLEAVLGTHDVDESGDRPLEIIGGP